tara:strand:+ start:268 stop:399 length:132 start_codon:yes stop_codon:yes gene_type:complete
MKGKNKDEMKKMCWCCVKRMERKLVNGCCGVEKVIETEIQSIT